VLSLGVAAEVDMVLVLLVAALEATEGVVVGADGVVGVEPADGVGVFGGLVGVAVAAAGAGCEAELADAVRFTSALLELSRCNSPKMNDTVSSLSGSSTLPVSKNYYRRILVGE